MMESVSLIESKNMFIRFVQLVFRISLSYDPEKF